MLTGIKTITMMKTYFKDLTGIFFPRLCPGCGRSLLSHEDVLCTGCWMELPRTRFHEDPSNPVSQTFWGRVPLVQASAFLYYLKGNRVQRLIHQLKYKGQRELGSFLGEEYGTELKKMGGLDGADLIIPVPLHPKKQRTRGYNQSELIAEGLGKGLGIPVEAGILIRRKATQTQTRKTRYRRWENVEGMFGLKNPERLSGKSLILVDDVITTGATLEACARELLKVKDVKLSVVALAYSGK